MDLNLSVEGTSVPQQQEENESVICSNPKSRAKKSRRKSKVWENYEEFDCVDEDGKARKKARCLTCENEYYADSYLGTSNLRRHTQSHKPERAIKSNNLSGELHEENGPDSCGVCGHNKITQEGFRERLTDAVISHDYPFIWVEHRKNRSLHLYLNGMVKPISRNTLKSDVVKKHARMKDELKGDLQKISSRICLTTDLWTSLTSRSFLCLTAHYVDENWKLNSKLLNFAHVPPPHTAFELKTTIYRMLKEWGIDNKIFAITMDNASNMTNMQNELREQLNGQNALLSHGKFFHVRCCAHILNLIVQDGLKVIRDGIRCVRESVKYVEGSEGRKIQFKECVEQSGMKCSKGLWLDVPTRWNSTFMMLDRAIFYRQAFVNLSRIDKYYKDCPTPQDWEKMVVLANLLRPFDAITKLFSGTKYPTINLFFENVCQIHFQLLKLSTSSDDVLRKMGNVMMSKFEKYWEDYNMVLAFGVILDPRCKLHFIQYLYGKLGGEYASKWEDIGDQLKIFFDEYKTTSSPSSSLTSQSTTIENCWSMDNDGHKH